MTPYRTLILVNLQNVGNFNMKIANKSQNLGNFFIFGKYMGQIYHQLGKCMGHFSFSQWHIPTKKYLENREYSMHVYIEI